MYEIRTHIDTSPYDDPHGLEEILGVHHDLAGAHQEADDIADETEDQLLANGEGHRNFWIELAIRDTTTGHDVAYTGIGLIARRARCEHHRDSP